MPKKHIPIIPLIPEQVKAPVKKRKAPELVLELPAVGYTPSELNKKKNSDEKNSGEVIISWDNDDLDCFIIS